MASQEFPSNERVAVCWMIRDVLLRSMDRGQFPLAMTAVVIVAMIFKMSSADVSKLAFEILNGLKDGSLIGYFFAAIFVAAWFKHVSLLEIWHKKEIARIVEVRNELQQHNTTRELNSTKDKKTSPAERIRMNGKANDKKSSPTVKNEKTLSNSKENEE